MDFTMHNLDILSKASVVLIAALNLFFAVKFFNIKIQKDDSEKEADRKINWLKSLILDHNLDHYYSFFDDLEIELKKLKANELTDTDKQQINEVIAEKFIFLRRSFIDMLLAVDNELYSFFIRSSDVLQDHITETIFDPGINLCHTRKFDEVLTDKVMETKTDCIKKIFGYRG